MEQKRMKHAEKMNQLKKHFKKLKLRAILLWLAFNIVADVVSIKAFSFEIIIFTIIISLIISTLIMINYLNRLDKIRIAQETQLMEETPMGGLRL